jgi:hypothetical protein
MTLIGMKIILSTLLTLSLLTGGVAFATDNESGKTNSGSKKHSSGSHKSNRTGHRKKSANVPSDK